MQAEDEEDNTEGPKSSIKIAQIQSSFDLTDIVIARETA